MALRSNPACIGKCEDEATGSLEGVEGREGVGVAVRDPESAVDLTAGDAWLTVESILGGKSSSSTDGIGVEEGSFPGCPFAF